MALGLPLLLVVERTVAMFAAWLAVGVVIAEAWRGRLPIEVSGRGVRYASAGSTHDAVRGLRASLRESEVTVERLRQDLLDVQDQLDRESRG